MIVSTIAFYLFAAMIIASAVMVIAARNPVHSVLFLILAFFNSAGLFVLLGAEFLAMILVIVYVGAVAVLFLFVVMMLDINVAELRKGTRVECATVCCCIDAQCEAADNTKAAARQVARELERIASAAAGRVTAADDRERGQVQRVFIASHVEERWRVIELRQQLGIVVITKCDR